MDTGLISSRYATALLRFARETQEEDILYKEAGDLKDALLDGTGIADCVEGLSETMRRFLRVVLNNRRAEFLPGMLRSYREMYRREKGITRASLTTATEDPGFAGKIYGLMKEQGYTKVEFKTGTDPELIGGFVLQVEDRRLDASVSGQLRRIRKELETRKKNKPDNG